MFVAGWQDIDELVSWCVRHVGHFIWTNSLTDWIGDGWTISRVKEGFDLRIVDEELLLLGVLRWT